MATVDVTLMASGEAAAQPWIWRLSREFLVEVNVVRATVDSDYGFMALQLTGPVEEIQRAVAWLHTTGLHVESIQRAVGA